MANEDFLRVLRKIDLQPMQFLKRVNEIARREKIAEAKRNNMTTAEAKKFKDSPGNMQGTGRGLRNTYGMSRAMLYKLMAEKRRVNWYKASLIMQVVDERRDELGIKTRIDFEEMGIAMYQKQSKGE